MRIRTEQPTDCEAISRIQYRAFKGHPLHVPGAEPCEPLIVERLRADGALSLSLLAEEDGAPVGHLALSPAEVGGAGGWLLLGPVGVLPERQGLGLGSALIREAVAWARAAGASGIVLVGDPAFYARFGFAARPGLGWGEVPAQYVLALTLAGDSPSGQIAYHAAFDCGQNES